MRRLLAGVGALAVCAALLLAEAKLATDLSPLLEPERVSNTYEPVLTWRLETARSRYLEAVTADWLLNLRDTVERELVRRGAKAAVEPSVIDHVGLRQPDIDTLRAWIRRAWTVTTPSEPAIAVAVALVPARSVARALGDSTSTSVALLIPRRDEPLGCLIVVPLYPMGRRYGRAEPVWQRAVEVLGPCAYVAAFGSPGRFVHRWFLDRQYPLSPRLESTDWRPGPLDTVEWHPDTTSIDWDQLIALNGGRSSNGGYGSGCQAGARQDCANAILDPERFRDNSILRGAGIVSDLQSPPVFDDRVRFEWGEHSFLADLIRVQGRDRFRAFWRSDLPVDQAFQAAYGESIGDWTYRWAVARYGTYAPGPTVSIATVLLAVSTALALLAFAATVAGRREVS